MSCIVGIDLGTTFSAVGHDGRRSAIDSARKTQYLPSTMVIDERDRDVARRAAVESG